MSGAKCRAASAANIFIASRVSSRKKSRELAVLETMDGGKTIKESRDVDLPLVAAHFFYHAGWADKLQYAFPGRNPQPLGVAGQIIPWNFPLLMAAWKIAPALACGNTVVLKPAETTSITAMRLAQIFQEAELPEGVVNIVTGAGETGAAIVNHPDIDKIAFTGSTEVGKMIAKSVAGTGKEADARTRRQGSEYYFRRCADRSGDRRRYLGNLFQPGPCLLRGFAVVRAGRNLSDGHPQIARSHSNLARGQSARQKHGHRRDQLEAATGEDPRVGAKRRRRRRGTGAIAVRAAAEGLLVPAELPDRRDGMRIAWRRKKFLGRC